MFNVFIKNSVAIDIADHTIEIAHLSGANHLAQIKNISRVKLSAGIITNGRIANKEKLYSIIEKLLKTAKPHPIITKELFFAIPEAQVYTHIFTLEESKKNSIQQLVQAEISKTIPITRDNLVYTYKIYPINGKILDILIIATQRDVLEEWQNFFKKLKIRLKFDVEILAARRAILEKKISEPVALIDFGAVSTQLAIFDKIGLKMSYSFYKAGEYLNEELSNNLHITLDQAANLKKRINLKIKNKNSAALIKILEPIINELKKNIIFWENKSKLTVKHLILLGGSSQIKGLSEYLVTQFKKPVKLAESILQDKKDKLLYLGAIGSALRGIDSRWNDDPTIILYEKSTGESISNLAFKKDTKKKVVQNKKITNKKPLNKLILLIIILVFGAILIVSILGYQKYQQLKVKDSHQQQQNNLEYIFLKSLQLSLPVATIDEEYTPDRIPGRLINNLQDSLKPNESLWPQAVRQEPISWLVYQSDAAQQLFIATLDDELSEDFILKNIEYLDVSASDNENIYFITGKISFLVKKDITLSPIKVVPPLPIKKEKQEPVVKKVIILDTPTGWLNIRQGPNVSYKIISKVNAGQEFILLEQQQDWFKLKLPSGETGWAFGEYVEKIP